MAFLAPPVLGLAAGGLAVLGGVGGWAWRRIQNNHPLILSEKLAWAKDHELAIDRQLRTSLVGLLQHFPEGSRIKLCFQRGNDVGFEYEHWFITNDIWFLEFGNGAGFTNHKVTVHANRKPPYFTKQTLTVDAAMRQRMAEVIGASNYCLLFRNCEHIANYVALGRWVSMQTIKEGRISKRLLDFVVDKQHLALRNLLPRELRIPSVSEGQPVDAQAIGYVTYNLTQHVLDVHDRHAYNVVFIGPTGSAKSTLINLLMNQKVAPTSDDCDSDVLSCTRNMQFYSGMGDCWVEVPGAINFTKMHRTINLIDTIGFCDSEMSSQEVYSVLKEQIEGNCMSIHRVVVCTSGKIEHHHAEAIKQFLGWLRYKPTGATDPVIFVYTKCDMNPRDSPVRRANNLVQMADKLGAKVNSVKATINGETRLLDLNIAVGFPSDAAALGSEDYKRLGDALFDVPMKHMQVERSWCSIL